MFFTLAFLIGGVSLCLLDNFAHALSNAAAIVNYHKQLQSFPSKQTYTRAELADAAWQVWTNRVSLTNQSTYTVEDLKVAISRPLLGTQQDSCDRVVFERAIGKLVGYREKPDYGMTAIGVVAMLVGAFLLGGILFKE